MLGAGVAYVAGLTISTYLHRSMHGGVEFKEPAKRVLRKVNWLTTGMAWIDWVDHLSHHAFPDRYDEKAHKDWNAGRPEGAPEAPAAVFRDPYSSKLEGYWKVHFNTPGLHRKAIKDMLPFVHKLNDFDKLNETQTRDHWPEHLRRVDVDEGDPAALRNKYKSLGIVTTWGAVGAVAGPAVAIPGAAVHIGAMFNMAGFINAETHTGQEKGFKNRLNVMLGRKDPVPDERGEFAANLLEGHEWLVAGEPRHGDHHANPGNPYLVGRKLTEDPPGFIIHQMVRLGLAETPGAIDSGSRASSG